MCLLQSGYYLSVKNHTLPIFYIHHTEVQAEQKLCNEGRRDRPNLSYEPICQRQAKYNILKKMLKMLIISNFFKLLYNKQTFFLIFNEKPQSGKYITTSLHNFSFKIYQSTLLPAPSPPSILYFEKYAMVYIYKGIINSV